MSRQDRQDRTEQTGGLIPFFVESGCLGSEVSVKAFPSAQLNKEGGRSCRDTKREREREREQCELKQDSVARLCKCRTQLAATRTDELHDEWSRRPPV